jgi:hypothetical protein
MNREGQEMGRNLHAVAAAGTLLITIAGAGPALAQKSGGVLKIYHRDSPASMSILEEATNSTEIPMMGVFNNLVLYKQNWRRTACNRSSRIWRPTGRGTRTVPN